MAEQPEEIFSIDEGSPLPDQSPTHTPTVDRSFTCPSCETVYQEVPDGAVSCLNCRWTGKVQLFDPLPFDVKEASAALPDNATCAHHPTKLASAVCTGTGDFICELCRVDLQGEPYSVQFLEAGGKEKIEKAYRRTLPRPDRAATNYLILCLIPYLNFLAILWIPLGIFQYFRIFPLRRKDPLFRRLCSTRRMALVGIGLLLFLAMWLFLAVMLTIFAFESATTTEYVPYQDPQSQQESWEEGDREWPTEE